MMRDRIGELVREKTARKILCVALFLGILAIFRSLFLLLVFFVAFESALGASSRFLRARTKLSLRGSIFTVVGGTLLAIALAIWLGAHRILRAVVKARDHFPERLAAIRESELYLQLKHHLPDADHVSESLQHHAESALHFAAAVGHILAYALIGFILAVIYWLERDEILAFHEKVDPKSIIGTLMRWFEHTAEAVGVTIQLQLVIAVFNTVTTLPVLLALHIPHVVPLMILIFLAALVPVAGNFVSGAILMLLAYQSKGFFGVGIFLVLTFILHKIEAYYLNPRLTARHVKLPSFVLILSLLAFEHLFGFAGLFLSFPFLFVASRIRTEWANE